MEKSVSGAARVERPSLWRILVVAAFVCVASAFMAAPAFAGAGQARVNLRIVDSADNQLTEAIVYSSSTRVRTSSQALCFGEGTGGSGGFAPTAVKRPNAMGVLADAAKELGIVRPLRVSDYYPFGQTLCGIGGIEASGSLYWAIWIGSRFVEESADNAPVRSGQSVVFQLTEEYPSTQIPARIPHEGLLPVVGAPGSRPVMATAAADRVLVRDGARDRVRCGGGEDTVYADSSDIVGADCETVRRG